MLVARFHKHDAASEAKYQEVKQLAHSQARILAGTPGTLKQRTQSGNRYWVREYIRVDGRKTDEYIGPERSVGKDRIEALATEIDLARALASGSAKLRLFGYQRMDRKPAAVMEVFFNRGLQQAGLVLVGSHAYAVLLNELGILAPGYRTQDIDFARAQPLAVALGNGATLQALLRETGLDFELWVPGKPGELVPVKELGAHAQAVPHLDFLVRDPIDGVVLSPNQVIPVKVPEPERFVLHKLFSSQSRRSDRDKAGKDLAQAAVLAAAVEDNRPGALRDAFRRMPSAAKAAVRRAARPAARMLEAHAEAQNALLELTGK